MMETPTKNGRERFKLKQHGQKGNATQAGRK